MEELRLVSLQEKFRIQYINFVEESKEEIKKCGMNYYIPISDDNSFLEGICILHSIK